MATATRVGKYEVGRTIGEGTFAKVKFAKNSETGECVAIKVLSKSTILKHKMLHQIKQEISVMKIVRHPYIVRLLEVLAGRAKIYVVLELVSGGELFDKIAQQGRLSEKESRRYFQQLIQAVSHCHDKRVYHRDLKPENLLLDSHGNLKVSDFGLSALPQEGVTLLYTTCGTPNYVAPEVLSGQGYNGAAADVWSCGVILYVLMAGYLPFEGTSLHSLYKKINAAEFSCPFWFSPGATRLIQKLLDPNPATRIKIEGIKADPWFSVNYIPVRCRVEDEVNLDDVRAVFDDIEDQFEAVETVAESMSLKVHTRNYKTRIEGNYNKGGHLAVVLEIYEVATSLFMVDIRKAVGDTLEYHKFYKSFTGKMEHIILKPQVIMLIHFSYRKASQLSLKNM